MSDDFTATLNGNARAAVTVLFDMMRPWQLLHLMSRHWQEVLDGRPALESEATEAQYMASHFRFMADELRALDDRESEEIDGMEAAGQFDEIHEHLADVAKSYTPKPRTYPHRYDSLDGRCVYCGGRGVTSHLPGEDCEVLRKAAESLRRRP